MDTKQKHSIQDHVVTFSPSPALRASCVLTQFSAFLERSRRLHLPPFDYDALHKWSIENPRAFWDSFLSFSGLKTEPQWPPAHVTSELVAVQPTSCSLPGLVNFSWFPNTGISISENMLLPAETRPNDVALVYCPENIRDQNRRQELTFGQLKRRVYALAHFLRSTGVRPGDVVAALLTNHPSAVIAMIATYMIGAKFTSCSPDLGELAVIDRLEQLNPVAVFITDGYAYKEKWFDVCGKSGRIVSRLKTVSIAIVCEGGDLVSGNERLREVFSDIPSSVELSLLSSILQNQTDRSEDCNILSHYLYKFDEPVLILFTSGTTGKPKALAHGPGVILNHVKEHRLHLNMNESSVVFQYTSTSWMMWSWMLSSLITSCRLILYDGAAISPQNPLRLLQIIDSEQVTHFGTSPGYLSALQKFRCGSGLEVAWKSLYELLVVMVTGSPSTTANFEFVSRFLGQHIAYISISGGTDICGCFCLGAHGWLPVIAPRLMAAGLGLDVRCLNDQGTSCLGVEGELCCFSPTPVYPLHFVADNDHSMYKQAYFSQYGDNVWGHGDRITQFGVCDGGGYVIHGRSDNVIKTNGVRIGPAELYRVFGHISWILESCVVGQRHGDDERIVALIVMRRGDELTKSRVIEIQTFCRTQLSPRHVPQIVLQVDSLPYTFSGKLSEKAAKCVLEDRPVAAETSIRNPECLQRIRQAYIEQEAELPAAHS